MSSRLIYDIGLNNGEDCEFYLAKGFDVLAIEANPILAKQANERFADQVLAGRLTILNIGIWSENKKMQFYRNLQNDHWSSFDPSYGCRDGTPFETIDVECQVIAAIIARYGIPYYMKIDVEGADKIILNDMRSVEARPQYISVEEYGVQAVDDLHDLGYQLFQVTAQGAKDPIEPPNPPREGSYFQKRFDGRDSGCFGKELHPGRWAPYVESRQSFITSIRDEQYRHVGPKNEWHDVHAASPRL